MSTAAPTESPPDRRRRVIARCGLLAVLAVTAAVYWSGLSGGFLFDDFPNIVDNTGLQIHHFSVPDLTRAALSSPSSEFKRPLASLTFALNYLASGLDPYWMKLTNLAIHLLNGLLVYALALTLLRWSWQKETARDPRWTALAITAGWLLLPINLTGVLYIVQRMASLANVFVLLGLLGYVYARKRRLAQGGYLWATAGALVLATAIGFTAKETAVMTPLYACLIEWLLFGFRAPAAADGSRSRIDRGIAALFVLVLALPLAIGLASVVPHVLQPGTWATRDFSLHERLLTEARVVAGYIRWTLLPTPHALSFYHDAYPVSTGWLAPWDTLVCALLLLGLAVFAFVIRRRAPLVTLGVGLFLGSQLLTGTILPLELVYEHRNYFASFGLLLALIPLLTARGIVPLARGALLAGLLVLWTAETAYTAWAWGNPLRLSQTLAARAPDSPRAQYGLGRTYVIYSRYDPRSPFTAAAYAPLERAMRLPGSSILPEQALIMMNSRMHKPLEVEWWNSIDASLEARRPGVQDVSSMEALTHCAVQRHCALPPQRMVSAFLAALSHPAPDPRLLASYGDYAWNVLQDHALALRMAKAAVAAQPNEPAYRITLIRELIVEGKLAEARQVLATLHVLNIGGRLDRRIDNLRGLIAARSPQAKPAAASSSASAPCREAPDGG